LRDRAAAAGEADIFDPITGDADIHTDPVAAQRIVVLERRVGIVERSRVARVTIVVEDEIPIQVIDAAEVVHAMPKMPLAF
jgi:hypothetical protein